MTRQTNAELSARVETLEEQVALLLDLVGGNVLNGTPVTMATTATPTRRRRAASNVQHVTPIEDLPVATPRRRAAAKRVAATKVPRQAQATSAKPVNDKVDYVGDTVERAVGYVRLDGTAYALVENQKKTNIYPREMILTENQAGTKHYVKLSYDKDVTVDSLKAAGARKITEKTFQNIKAALVKEAIAKNGK